VALEIEMSKPRLNRVESRDGYNNPWRLPNYKK
jgi:hypothetical protein